MMIFLFGKLGCGKNFVGRILEQEFGFDFYDADEDLTDAMKEAIQNHQEITDELRDEFINIVINRLTEKLSRTDRLAVAQALFRNKHRHQVLEHFPGTLFVWVHADDKIMYARLSRRSGHIASKSYGEMINRNFETPNVPHTMIDNNAGRDEIITQLKGILDENSEN